MSVVTFVELSGRSSESFEDAIREAVERATSTIRNVRSVWAKEFAAIVENNQVTEFQVIMRGFEICIDGLSFWLMRIAREIGCGTSVQAVWE